MRYSININILKKQTQEVLDIFPINPLSFGFDAMIEREFMLMTWLDIKKYHIFYITIKFNINPFSKRTIWFHINFHVDNRYKKHGRIEIY